MYQHNDIPQPKWDKKNKKWVLSVMIDGQRKQFVSRTPKMPGKKECRQRCLEWIENGMYNDGNLPVSKAFERFLKDYKDRYGETEQFFKLKSLSDLFIIPVLGKKKCSQITLNDWQNVINNAKPTVKHRADGTPYQLCDTLSKKYLKNIKGVISSFISWAAPRHFVEYTPMSQIYIPAAAPTVGKDILQLSDIEKLFAEPTGLWFERALMLEVLTGLRPGEILGLQKNDYDPQTGSITIRRSVNARGNITTGKNANAHRTIELTPEVRQIVDEQLVETAYLESEWIFCNTTGLVGAQAQLLKCWKRIAAKKGFPASTTPYSLRHTFYTHTEAYLPDRVIKSIFGHSAKTDGHSIYGSHVVNEEAHEAAKRLSVTPLYQATIKKENAE